MSPQERKQLQLANARERKATAALARATKKNLELKAEIERLKKEIEELLKAPAEPKPKRTRKSPSAQEPAEPEVTTDGTSD